MKRREFIALLGGAAASWPPAVRAQQGERVRRVGLLPGYAEGDVEGQASAAAFQERLQELGWTKGRNIQIDIRWTGGDPDKARTFAKELVNASPDLIVPTSNLVTAILQKETSTIPILFVLVGDPVGSGFVASLARPGGDITGFAIIMPRSTAISLRLSQNSFSRLTLVLWSAIVIERFVEHAARARLPSALAFCRTMVLPSLRGSAPFLPSPVFD
jgi:hypothetical protein